jgi:hypothetical protein
MSWEKVIVVCCGCERVFVGRDRWIRLDKWDEEEVLCRHTVCSSCYEKHLRPLKFGAVLPGMRDVCYR